MSKKTKIKKLQQQIDELEARLATSTAKEEPAKLEKVELTKKQAKTAVNVYFDSEFVNGINAVTTVNSSESVAQKDKAAKKRKAKRKSKVTFGGFVKVFFKSLVVLLITAVILVIVSLVAMVVIWLLVNFDVMTSDANPVVELLWKGLGYIFKLFGRDTIPMI